MGHFVEQLLGVEEAAAFAVHENELRAEESIGAEGGGLKDVGVQLLALERGLLGSTEVKDGRVGVLLRRPLEWK